MIKPLFLVVILTLPYIHQDLSMRGYQDVRVLTYSTVGADSSQYESLSFWIKSNQRAYIRYMHGRDADDVELNWAGLDSLHGGKGFRLRFPAPDTTSWVVIPKENTLSVTDRWGKYRKEYHWENENTAPDSTCSFCAQNEKQAMSWLQRYFLR